MWLPGPTSLLLACAACTAAGPLNSLPMHRAALAAPLPAPAPQSANGTLNQPKKDLESSAATATGYIYRKDGNKPALFLKLGAGRGAGDGFSFEQQQQQQYQQQQHVQQQQQQRPQRPLLPNRLGKLDGLDEHLETTGHNFGPGDFAAGEHANVGGHQVGGAEDLPHHFGPEHLDAPGAGAVHESPDHLEPGAGLEDHAYFNLGLGGDVAEEYLAPLKSARTKHATKSPTAEEYGEDYKALDDYTALKTIGDEFSPLKLPAASEEFGASQVGIERSAPLKTHADYHHGGYGGGGGGGGHGKSYSKGGGSKHSSDSFSAHGSKGAKAHKSTKSHGGGSAGAHGAEAHKGHFSNSGGAKKVHHDEAGKYGSHHTDTKGSAGGKHGEKGHGKKGHKSTGFHNVYNKDEFKKDTSFYDSHDKGGQHHKGGDYASQHGGKSGAHKKGGHHGSAYDEGHKGKNSHVDKGQVSDAHKANKGASSHESHYGNKEEYAKKGGASSGKKYSHKGGGGGGGGDYGHHR